MTTDCLYLCLTCHFVNKALFLVIRNTIIILF